MVSVYGLLVLGVVIWLLDGNVGIPAALINDAKSSRDSIIWVGGCTVFWYICICAYMAAVCMYSISSLPVVNVSIGGWLVLVMI